MQERYNKLKIGGNPRSRKTILALEEHIARIRQERPTINAHEIRLTLIDKGICSRSNAPTISSIHKYVRLLVYQNILQFSSLKKEETM